MLQGTVKEITMETVHGEVMALKNDGQRFMTMTTVQISDEDAEIIYHFDKDYKMTHLRMPCKLGQPVPSISGIFFSAMLAENEARDQFALTFDGLVLDFNRTLYLDEEVTSVPLVNKCKIEDKE